MDIGLNFQGIVLFFIFIVPGFLFTRTYLTYRPRYYRAPNAFEQTALALVGSAIIHNMLLAAVTLGVLIAWLATNRSFSVGMLFGPTIPITQYPLHILALYLNLLTGYILLSLIIARRGAIFLGKRTPTTLPRWWTRIIGEDPPENLLLWYIILQEEPLKKGLLWPKIGFQLRNGDYFEGRLNRLKLVGDEENTIELAITEVGFRAKGEPPTADLKALKNQTVLLQSRDILWLSRADTP
jgi:hypothetical protein